MTREPISSDLIVLVPDMDAETTVRAVLARHQALGIRPIAFDVRRHVQRDSGCRSDCHHFLRLSLQNYRYAMVLFDDEGSGREGLERTQLDLAFELALHTNGWQDRAAVVVLDPELEAWVWSDSPEVDTALGWTGRDPPLRPWVQSSTHYWVRGGPKPERPKEAFDSALRAVGKAHSASIFEDIAGRVSLVRCTDPAFVKFKGCLQRWFPVSGLGADMAPGEVT